MECSGALALVIPVWRVHAVSDCMPGRHTAPAPHVTLQTALAGMHDLPTLLLLGACDECYPEGTDVPRMGQRLAAAVGSTARVRVLDGDHSMHGAEEETVNEVAEWVAALPDSASA